jgi:ADP-heptose:LPS heptosyltransferase
MINPEKILKKITLKLLGPFLKKKISKNSKPDWRKFKRVLIFRLDNKLGNAILLLPLIQSIKKSLPGIKIDVMYSVTYSEIFEDHPDINKIIPYKQHYLLKIPTRYIGFIKKLRRIKYDVIFSSTNSNSFSVSQAFFANLLKSEFTIGFDWKDSAVLYSAVVCGNTKVHYSQAQVDLWRYFDENAKPQSPKIYFAQQNIGNQEIDKILFWFGATGNKILPGQLFKDIIKFFNKNNLLFQLAAGPHDEHLLNLYSSVQKKDVIFMQGSIKDTAIFFNQYKMIFIPDTGPMHLTIALGLPTVQIFVNSNPVWYAYRGDNVFLINKNLDSEQLKNFTENWFN